MASKTVLLLAQDAERARAAELALRDVAPNDLVTVVSDADAAAEALESGDGASIQLALLETQNDLSLLEKIRAKYSALHVPIVLFLDGTTDAAILEAYEKGANSCVDLPDDADAYRDAVREVGQYWLSVHRQRV